MRDAFQGFRQRIRSLLRTPRLTLPAVLILGVAVGANTAMFSVVYGVLLRPLPFAEPDRLVALFEVGPGWWGRTELSLPTLEDWRAADPPALEGMVAMSGPGPVGLTGTGEPVAVERAAVSGDFFELLGVTPARGRTFTAADDRADAPPVAVVSWSLWQSRFGADPAILGRTIPLDGRSHRVVGVAPEGFGHPDETEVWVPLLSAVPEAREIRGAHIFRVVGRLTPGATAERVTAQLTAASRGVAEYGGEWSALAVPLDREMTGEVRPALLLLWGAVGFVLLIASANVASLLLARVLGRRREVAVRAALGAGRWRIAADLLGESVLLAVAGGGLGLLLTAWGMDLLLALNPQAIPRANEIAVDGGVLAFALAVSLLTGLLAGGIPALQVGRTPPAPDLKEGSTGAGSSRDTGRIRSGLVVAEVALSVVLLVGAGVMARSLFTILGVDPGFRASRVMTYDLRLPEHAYPGPAEQRTFFDEVLERLEEIPLVREAAVSRNLPVSGSTMTSPVLTGPWGEGDEPPMAQVSWVGPGYFRSLGIELVEGRVFGATDREGSEPVAVVSRSLARRLFAEGALGRRAHHAFGDQEMREIVGVVDDVRHRSLTEEPPPVFYVPFAQEPAAGAALVVRAEVAPAVVNELVREVIRDVDPELPIQGVATMEERITRTVARPRFYAAVLGVFALLALVLALGGFYAVLAHCVSRRRRELSVRVAVGADPRELVGMIVRRGLVLTGVGVALGLGGAYFATRLLDSLLFGVGATDPVTFASVGGLMVVAALLASLVPALRATRVDPITFVAVPALLMAVAALASWAPARRAAATDPARVLRE